MTREGREGKGTHRQPRVHRAVAREVQLEELSAVPGHVVAVPCASERVRISLAEPLVPGMASRACVRRPHESEVAQLDFVRSRQSEEGGSGGSDGGDLGGGVVGKSQHRVPALVQRAAERRA